MCGGGASSPQGWTEDVGDGGYSKVNREERKVVTTNLVIVELRSRRTRWFSSCHHRYPSLPLPKIRFPSEWNATAQKDQCRAISLGLIESSAFNAITPRSKSGSSISWARPTKPMTSRYQCITIYVHDLLFPLHRARYIHVGRDKLSVKGAARVSITHIPTARDASLLDTASSSNSTLRTF